MLKINTNNGRAVAFCALEENGNQYDGVRIKHLNHKNETEKAYFIQGGDIITLLNIYNYAKEKGFTLDNIANDLMEAIDSRGYRDNLEKGLDMFVQKWENGELQEVKT